MASSHKTEHYGLSQFAPLDRPAWLVDYNTDMEKIDTALHNLDETGGGGGTLDQTARDMAQAAQDAAKDAQEMATAAQATVDEALEMATAAQATADEALEKAEEALNQQGAISGDITNINEEITQIKNDVNTAEEALELAQGCVKKSGDTMTGVLKLAGNPVDNADAANKGYVDSVAGNPFPDVPFTDDRWKFAGEVDTAAKKIQFTRVPREFLFVVSVEPTQQGIAQLNIQTVAGGADNDFPLCNLTDSPITEIAVQRPVVLTTHSQNHFSLRTPGQNTSGELIYIENDFSSMVKVIGKTGTGSIKIYWR